MGLLKLNLPENPEDFNMCLVLGITDRELDIAANTLADISVRLARAMMGMPSNIRNNMDLLVELNELDLKTLMIGALADKAASTAFDIENGSYTPEYDTVPENATIPDEAMPWTAEWEGPIPMQDCSDYPEPSDCPPPILPKDTTPEAEQ